MHTGGHDDGSAMLVLVVCIVHVPAVIDTTPIAASAWNYPGSRSTSHIPEPALSGRIPTGEQAGPDAYGTPPKALNLERERRRCEALEKPSS